MNFQKIAKRNAGFTMVELMIATVVLSGGMVAISGSMMSFSAHNSVSEQRAMSTGVTRSVIEDLRGLTIEEIIVYEAPVDNAENNTIFISGVGEARVQLYAVVPDEDTQSDRWVALGPNTSLDPAVLPNPLEIQVEVVEAQEYFEGGHGYSTELYSVSTLVSY